MSNIFSTFLLENNSSVLIGLEQSTEIPQTLALTIPYNHPTQPHLIIVLYLPPTADAESKLPVCKVFIHFIFSITIYLELLILVIKSFLHFIILYFHYLVTTPSTITVTLHIQQMCNT